VALSIRNKQKYRLFWGFYPKNYAFRNGAEWFFFSSKWITRTKPRIWFYFKSWVFL